MEHIAIYKPLRVSEIDELTGKKINTSAMAQVFAVADTLEEISSASIKLPKDRYHTAQCSTRMAARVVAEGESLGRLIIKNGHNYVEVY